MRSIKHGKDYSKIIVRSIIDAKQNDALAACPAARTAKRIHHATAAVVITTTLNAAATNDDVA